jgi:hypothetical protein
MSETHKLEEEEEEVVFVNSLVFRYFFLYRWIGLELAIIFTA